MANKQLIAAYTSNEEVEAAKKFLKNKARFGFNHSSFVRVIILEEAKKMGFVYPVADDDSTDVI